MPTLSRVGIVEKVAIDVALPLEAACFKNGISCH